MKELNRIQRMNIQRIIRVVDISAYWVVDILYYNPLESDNSITYNIVHI